MVGCEIEHILRNFYLCWSLCMFKKIPSSLLAFHTDDRYISIPFKRIIEIRSEKRVLLVWCAQNVLDIILINHKSSILDQELKHLNEDRWELIIIGITSWKRPEPIGVVETSLVNLGDRPLFLNERWITSSYLVKVLNPMYKTSAV